ncbi:MAG: exosortase [Phycisphaerales bacterium]|nr:MAG: exosortase [Phycisphaerales bacterium]
MPTALWPVLGRPVLERLLSHLADQGIRQVIVCCNGERQLLVESIRADDRLQLEFHDELLPVGTAGCIRDASAGKSDGLLVVLPASTTCPPEIDWLVSEHRRGRADLTVFLNPNCEKDAHTRQSSGIYLCNSDILQHIPEAGYFDIKEGLIPELLSSGKTVQASQLQRNARIFRDRRTYLRAVECCIGSAPSLCGNVDSFRNGETYDVWVSAKAKIESDARVYGPAVIMDDVTIADGTVVLGPAVLECDSSVSRNSIVVDSILWSGARIEPNCRIEGSVIDHDAIVLEGSVVQDKAVTCTSKHRSKSTESCPPLLSLTGPIGRIFGNAMDRAGYLKRELHSLLERVGQKLPDWARLDKTTVATFLGSSIVMTALIWSYRSGVADLWDTWRRSDEYSSGLLVPFLAIYILWVKRSEIALCPIRPSAWGLLAFAGAQTVRFLGLFLMYGSAERLSIVLSIVALILLLFGWQLLKKVYPILLFLCLMLPWPNSIQNSIGLNLQRYATSSAVFCLEVIGYEIVQDGNVIRIGDVSVAVLEACNGLRMITAFFVISGLVVLLVNRTWWEKLIVLASSLPIALLCNTIRLAVTAMFFTVLEGENWVDVFHDFGGYAMMPLALAVTVGELWLLNRLTSLPAEDEAIVITRQGG